MDTQTSPAPAPPSFAALIERARARGPVRVAVADAAQEVVLDALREAQRMGLATPHLVGDPDEIAPIMARLGWEAGAVELTASAPDADAAARAVAMVHEGRADVVMKGNLHTDVFMRALLDSETGLRLPDRRVSHLFVLQIPDHDRLIGVTDAAINIAPDLAAKAQIAQNAIAAFHAIGVAEPRLAVLSAVETVTPAIASTLDAAALTLMARRGQITGALVDGPLALDNAISARAAAEKGIRSDVAGQADILLVPDLVTGNVLAKALDYLGGAEAAGVALGLRVPVVLTSRADTGSARLSSLAFAALLGPVTSAARAAGRRRPDTAPSRLRPAPQPEQACCPLDARQLT